METSFFNISCRDVNKSIYLLFPDLLLHSILYLRKRINILIQKKFLILEKVIVFLLLIKLYLYLHRLKQFAKAYLKPNDGRKVENRLTSHSGRRYFATKLGNTPGITTKQMMALGGWESPDVAMRYVEVNEEQLDDPVARATL